MFCSIFRAHGGACWWDIRLCFVLFLGPMVGHAGGILGVLFLF